MNPLELVAPPYGSGARTCLLTAEKSYILDELMSLAAGLRDRLADLGMSGQKGIVSLKNGPDFFAGLVGAWMAGAVPVLLDPMVKGERRVAVEMTDSRFVISDARGGDDLPSGVETVVPDRRQGEPEEISGGLDDAPILHLVTSGSTGTPTLVPKTFMQIKVEVDFISRLFDYPRRVATLVPWCHIWGILSSFFVPLSAGGVCDLTAGVSGRTVLERAAEGLLDLVVAVPAYYQAMVRLFEAGVVRPVDGRSAFASSSAPLSAALRQRFNALSGCRLTDIYGSTEAGGIAYRHHDGPWTVQPHVEIRIDRENALWVRSPSVSFEPQDGFYRIGDLVEPTEGGFILIGRKDDVVKIGGRRIALGEVQAAFEACEAVQRAALLAVEQRGALRLAAFLEPSSSTGSLDVDAVKQFVRGRLADHKIPGIVRVLDRLPMTSSGKLARQELMALLKKRE